MTVPKVTVCPFFKEEIYNGDVAIGIKCKGAEIRFANKIMRRMFVYPLCGSVGNFKNCVIYKHFAKAADKK